MKIVTSAEMREIDRLTTTKHNVPSLTLMENAGSAVAGFVLRQYPNTNKITVVCGKGNNGGDGFVAARKLHEAGKQVTALLLSSQSCSASQSVARGLTLRCTGNATAAFGGLRIPVNSNVRPRLPLHETGAVE